jgi:hypothetical protein
MENLTIENPEDWDAVSKNLRLLIEKMPEFYNDYLRIRKNLEIKIKELAVIDTSVRRHNTLYHQQLREEKLKEINHITRTFSKMYLIASLSKR